MTGKSQYKFIISGPVGAGKTTAIATLSDIPPVVTDATPTDEVAEQKHQTTVAMDYGTIRLEGGQKVHLYGTPGQERFDFMWDIMTEGALGLLLLLDNSRPDPLDDLERFLRAFSPFLDQAPFCVGITHTDVAAEPPRSAYNRLLAAQGRVVPVFTVDPRSKPDMNLLMLAMLSMIDPSIALTACASREGAEA